MGCAVRKLKQKTSSAHQSRSMVPFDVISYIPGIPVTFNIKHGLISPKVSTRGVHFWEMGNREEYQAGNYTRDEESKAELMGL